MSRGFREKRKRGGLGARASVILAGLLLSFPAFAQSGEKFLGNIFNGLPDPIFDQYWNQITPENVGKWGSVEIVRDKMTWSGLDLMFDYAQEQGFPVKQHTFIWGQQEPLWLADLPPDEQRAEVEEWMELFAERYPDVEMIDVVNEAQHAPPSFKDAIGGEGETGWDWIIWSFEKARELFPNATAPHQRLQHPVLCRRVRDLQRANRPPARTRPHRRHRRAGSRLGNGVALDDRASLRQLGRIRAADLRVGARAARERRCGATLHVPGQFSRFFGSTPRSRASRSGATRPGKCGATTRS